MATNPPTVADVIDRQTFKVSIAWLHYFLSLGNGSTGATGPPGPTGPTGPTGPPGTTVLSMARVTLSNTQIKALPTTGVQIVSAPDGSHRIVLSHAVLRIDSSAGAYTNIAADGFGNLEYSSGDLLSNYFGNDTTTSPVLTDFTFLLDGGVRSAMLTPYTRVTTPASREWGNAAQVVASYYAGESARIRFFNGSSGDLTGGHASNTGSVTTFYSVELI